MVLTIALNDFSITLIFDFPLLPLPLLSYLTEPLSVVGVICIVIQLKVELYLKFVYGVEKINVELVDTTFDNRGRQFLRMCRV